MSNLPPDWQVNSLGEVAKLINEMLLYRLSFNQ